MSNIFNEEGLYPDGTPIFLIQVYQDSELKMEFEGDMFDDVIGTKVGETYQNISITKRSEISENPVLYKLYTQILDLCNNGYITIIHSVRGIKIVEANDVISVKYTISSRTEDVTWIKEAIVLNY